MKPRRLARSLALEVLYEAEMAHRHPLSVLERRLTEAQYPPDVADFARGLITGVAEHRESLDDTLAAHAPGWPLSQISPVDASLLRLAILELGHGDVPRKVAINEAVELAKRYGGESSPRFVNGVLGAVVRDRVTAGAQEQRKSP